MTSSGKIPILGTIRAQLLTLDNTETSIQSTSRSIRFWSSSASIIVPLISSYLKESPKEKKLLYWYLINDIIQNDFFHSEKPIFPEKFIPYIPELIEDMKENISKEEEEKVIRTLEIWREREVFNSEFLDKIHPPTLESLGKEILELIRKNDYEKIIFRSEKLLNKVKKLLRKREI